MIDTTTGQELFEDVIGQPLATSILKAVLQKEHIAPAYLLTGPEGVGKKLCSKRFLEGLLTTGNKNSCKERSRIEALNHPDLMWIEPTYLYQGNLIAQSETKPQGMNRKSPPQIRLEQIRGAKRFLSKTPIEAKLEMVVIERIDYINEAASNALLKTLEEPGNGIFILLCERPEKLLQTIKSRCQIIPFNGLDRSCFKEALLKANRYEQHDLERWIESQELMQLSKGSPGLFHKNIELWKTIPEHLWPQLNNFPTKPIDALSLAKELSESLELEEQLWLISWLQVHVWISNTNLSKLKRLEKLRSQLLGFVQPRLAWEISLLDLGQIITH